MGTAAKLLWQMAETPCWATGCRGRCEGGLGASRSGTGDWISQL